VMIRHFGLNGAAFAWFIRMLVDTAIMFSLTRKFLARAFAGLYVLPALVLAGVMLSTASRLSAVPKHAMVFSALVLIGFVPLSWSIAMDSRERAWASRFFSRRSLEEEPQRP
jgi:hypothetical protein